MRGMLIAHALTLVAALVAVAWAGRGIRLTAELVGLSDRRRGEHVHRGAVPWT